MAGRCIIAVCDAFTAMTSPRPYATQLTLSQAIAELQCAAGTQFDPTVVQAFAELAVDLIWPPDQPATQDHADAVRHGT